ncbi:MAG: TerC family protein [Alphaproteobacteria bacterium]|nr:TerC family protein [Alphaproteobacteria bacterium]
MDFGSNVAIISILLKLVFIDLLMSGDNAIAIAMASRSLAPEHRRLAILFGTGAAIVLRLVLAVFFATLLDLPYVKLLGGLALLIIGVRLTAEESGANPDPEGGYVTTSSLRAAIGVILFADVMMSLDNVVALVAAAQGNVLYLAFGLAVSIPLLIYGSLALVTLMDRYPFLPTAGGMLLGWIAGDIVVADTSIAAWIASQSPALAIATPLAGAVFVLLESRIVAQERRKAPRPAPKPRKPAPRLPRVAPSLAPPAPAFLAPSVPAPSPPVIPSGPAPVPPDDVPSGRWWRDNRRTVLRYGVLALFALTGFYLGGGLYRAYTVFTSIGGSSGPSRATQAFHSRLQMSCEDRVRLDYPNVDSRTEQQLLEICHRRPENPR